MSNTFKGTPGPTRRPPHVYLGVEMKYFFWVCVNSYQVDDKEIQRGAMQYHSSERPIVSDNWRVATQKEVDEMKTFKGRHYNHNI